MKTISTIAALALLGASASAFSGEDSTANWGEGGTGPAFWATECGLEHFPGPTAESPKPCSNDAGQHYQTSDHGVVPMRVQSAFAGGSAAPIKDGHGGRKKPETRK
ncbi:MAG: hypothetical protein JOZ85_18545 [Betaproteobacteria bacterium]|nr:hypothetical protein [Betaproteobacteria bacterium]